VEEGAFSEDEMRKPTPQRYALPCRSAKAIYGLVITAQEGGSALEMDVSKGQPKITAGLDLGDKATPTSVF
jgi:hypothetical protein